MIVENQEKGLESKLALASFLQVNRNGNRNKRLTRERSEQNIKDNLVSVRGFKEHSLTALETKNEGSGLLITTDGWTLTAYHNVEKYFDEWKKIQEEKSPTDTGMDCWNRLTLKYGILRQNIHAAYPIDPTVCRFDPTLDIALIKAIIPRKPKPLRFRIAQEDLKVGEEIRLSALVNYSIYRRFGIVTDTNINQDIIDIKTLKVTHTVYDAFVTTAPVVHGVSGCAYTTLKGEYAGLCVFGKKDGSHSAGAKIRNILKLVEEMVCALDKEELYVP